MSENRSRSIVPSQGGGIFQGIATRIKLILRLMGDRRVSPLLKLLPIGSLVYLVIPDLMPTPIDDALVIWLGSTLFVELCPSHIVKEHLDALNSVIEGEWREIHEEKDNNPRSQQGG
jgi:hypothetical protein